MRKLQIVLYVDKSRLVSSLYTRQYHMYTPYILSFLVNAKEIKNAINIINEEVNAVNLPMFSTTNVNCFRGL